MKESRIFLKKPRGEERLTRIPVMKKTAIDLH